MKPPRISIIMPCYNVEKYVAEAIESVLAQTFTDWELIILNDGSTDATPRICERYAARDPRIKYFSGPNLGVSQQRNAGLEKASGELIAFLDSDDMLLPDSLSILLYIKEKYDVDIAQGAFIGFSDMDQLHKDIERGRNITQKKKKISQKVGESDEFFGKTMIFSGKESLKKSLFQTVEVSAGRYVCAVNASNCGRLFSRKLFEGLQWKAGELYEDMDMFYPVALRCRRYALTTQPVYLYRDNPTSILHTFNRNRLSVLEVTRRAEEFIARECPELTAAARDRRFAANYNMYRLMSSLPAEEKVSYSKEIASTRRYIRRHALSILLTPGTRSKNRLGALAALLLPTPILSRL